MLALHLAEDVFQTSTARGDKAEVKGGGSEDFAKIFGMVLDVCIERMAPELEDFHPYTFIILPDELKSVSCTPFHSGWINLIAMAMMLIDNSRTL